jgi:hypothetical protein
LGEKEILKLCEICTGVSVAFVKTSTGYGFVKQPNGDYNYKGATIEHLELMKKHVGGGHRRRLWHQALYNLSICNFWRHENRYPRAYYLQPAEKEVE